MSKANPVLFKEQNNMNSESTTHYYIAKTPDGKYLIDANWADENGGYDLVFAPAVFGLNYHRIYKNCNLSDMLDKINNWVSGIDVGEEFSNYEIFQVKETISREFTKI